MNIEQKLNTFKSILKKIRKNVDKSNKKDIEKNKIEMFKKILI